MRLFHYHLAAAREREVELAYVERGFELVARFGRVGAEHVAFDADHGWDELDRRGFRLRLTQLERDGIEVVVQPGRWQPPRVDHVGVFVSLTELETVVKRGRASSLTVQDRGDRRTFVSTGTGMRLEVRRDADGEIAPLALELATADPVRLAGALASLLGLTADGVVLHIGESTIRLLPGGPAGRPQFVADGLGGGP